MPGQEPCILLPQPSPPDQQWGMTMWSMLGAGWVPPCTHPYSCASLGVCWADTWLVFPSDLLWLGSETAGAVRDGEEGLGILADG